jgi:hypothetical protein
MKRRVREHWDYEVHPSTNSSIFQKAWSVRPRIGSRAVRSYDTQAEAIAFALTKGVVRVYGADGKVEGIIGG